MRRIRVLTLPVLAALLFPCAASAAAGDPYVIYTANNYADGAVIVRTDPGADTAVEISRNGPQGSLFQRPYDLAIDASGDLLVADMGTVCNETRCAEDGRIIRVDSLTGAQSLVAEGAPMVDPAGLAIAPGGTIYVADNYEADNSGAVIRVDPSSGAKTKVSEGGGLDLPFGILVDRDGSLVVSNRALPGVCAPALGGNLVRVQPADGAQQVISSGGLFSYPLGVALDSAGQIVFVNECGDPGLARVVDGLTQGALTSNNATDLLVTPERMALDPAGNFLVSDWSLGDGDGGIVGVDAATGAQRLVRGGELFNHPLGIAAVVNRPPVAALDLPRLVAAGDRVTLDASASRDPENLRLVYEWDFNGDGVYERGTGSVATTTRAWARDGRATVRVRVNDRNGARSVAQGVMGIDGSTPRITRVTSDARVLAAGARRRGAKRPRSARLRFRLSEAAAVTVTVRRAAGGRRAGKALVFKRDGRAGMNSLLLRARGRRPGSYRLVIEAVDAVGHEATPRRLGLRIVRRPAAARR